MPSHPKGLWPRGPAAGAALLSLLLLNAPAWGREPVFRCGNEYTNDPRQARQAGCTVLELGPVTVPGTSVVRSAPLPAPEPSAAPAARPPPVRTEARPASRIDAAEQRARDSDARLILVAELRRAQERLAQLQAEFKNGQPDKQGIEGRNHQRYLDRVQSLREALVRQQDDVASLKRELARWPGAEALAAAP